MYESEGQDVRQRAEQTASTVVEQVQQVAETNVATQKDRAAETLGTVAQTLRDTSSSMREQQPQIASLAEQAATRVEDISNYVREHDIRDFVGEAERFARREPLIFLGGAFAVGFLAARFLKATQPGQSRGAGQYGGSSFYGGEPSGSQFGDMRYEPTGASSNQGMYGGGEGYGSGSQAGNGSGDYTSGAYSETGSIGSTGAAAGAAAGAGIAGSDDWSSSGPAIEREPELAGSGLAYSSDAAGYDTDQASGLSGDRDETSER